MELVTAGRLQFIMIGAFALRDKIRTDVRSAVRFAREDGQMSVRMLSGDHIETATAVARQAGIIGRADQGGRYTVMHAD